MAGLFKLRLTRYVDAAGRRVKKDSPGASVVREKSRKWYGEFRDAGGAVRRVALLADKAAAQAMLGELVRKSERRFAGLVDPFKEHGQRPIAEHFVEYESHCRAKGDSDEYVRLVQSRLRKLATGCGFDRLADVDAAKATLWLGQQRMTCQRFSAQTSNFYLDAFKYFCNWLVRNERLPKNPLAAVKRVSIEVDRRHDRRPLTDDEFQRLIVAADGGGMVQGVSGSDRAMLYLVASWTGFRRRELASLTLGSLDLDGPTPLVRLRAAYSKRRREDVIPLHAYLVDRLRAWLANRSPQQFAAPLFALRTLKGDYRRTSVMMRKDLAAARAAWMAESPSEAERIARERSDFLSYQSEEGLFADFHANRHRFISNLSRAGVALAVAQKLARHSDPRLTANRYTHLALDDQAAAIASLPSPRQEIAAPSAASAASGPDGRVAGGVAGTAVAESQPIDAADSERTVRPRNRRPRKGRRGRELGNDWQAKSLAVLGRPEGAAPATPGSSNRGQCGWQSGPLGVTGFQA